MKVWIGAALVVAIGLAVASPADATNAAQTTQAVRKSDATDLGARRVHRRSPDRAFAHSYPPTYYARPVFYRPYPYPVPAPFFLGFAYLPYW